MSARPQGFSEGGEVDGAEVVAGEKPARGEGGRFGTEENLVAAGGGRGPDVLPEIPSGGGGEEEFGDRDIGLAGIELDFEAVDGLRAAPLDANDVKFDFAICKPLFNADGHGGDVERGRGEVTREFGDAGLRGAAGIFLHLGSGGGIIGDKRDFVDPLDAGAPVPIWNEEADRSAVVGRERLAVHFGGEEGAGGLELGGRKDPTGTGDGTVGGRGVAVEAGDEDAVVG